MGGDLMSVTYHYMESLPVEGRRYPLEPGAEIKVRGERLRMRLHEIRRTPSGIIELVAWEHAADPGGRGQWRVLDLSRVEVTSVARP